MAMSATEFTETLDKLQMKQVEAAELLDTDARTIRSYVQGRLTVPQKIELALRLMRAARFTQDEARELIGLEPRKRRAAA